DAPHASLLVSNIGAHAQARVSAGGVSTAHGDAWGRTAPGWIRLERSGSSVTAFLSSDGVSWSVLGSVTVPDLAGPALVGLAVSAADFGAGTTATAQFRDVSVTTSTPDEWSAFDVGTPAAAGSTTASGDSFVLTGSGDIWSQEDRFHLASRELPADGAIVARVQIPDGSQEWSKSGLMVRRSAAPGSAHAWFGFSRIGLHLQYRPNTSESSTTPYDDWGARTAEWLRLERSGTTVAAFRSPDGATWTPVRSVTVPGLGSGPVLVGLAVSAADFGNGLTATGEFTSVLVIEADGAVSGGTASLEMDRQQVEAAGFAIDAVYPNPLRGRAAVLAQVPEDAEVTLALYDVLGRQLAQETVQVAAGVRDLALDLRDVPAGAYLLVLRNETTGESETRSVTVVR
ncbi:MAG: T9SS type A sorting domain-containing protein, partial [Bacteroidota bacterium]